MSEREEGWSEMEVRALKELPRELSPRPELEQRIVAALAERGLVRARRSGRGRLGRAAAAVAAGLLLVAAGIWIGRTLPPGRARTTAPDTSPRFVLFLLRGQESDRPEEEGARVAEYRAWARGLAASGRSVSGEKLDDREERLGADGAPVAAAAAASEEEIRGYFVVSAASLDDALAVARGCPHLRHGGRIVVRPIVPT
ncbi:MAG TPA: YciI family protein [Thermoanaerobaculia bacterium]|nr:YciI family protein [Thermoanaerobaculia bacterium]